MTRPIARDAIYRRRGFQAEIIELCVRWYITYRLSYRDLVAMMGERGIVFLLTKRTGKTSARPRNNDRNKLTFSPEVRGVVRSSGGIG